MAPGGQTQLCLFCHTSLRPLANVFHWLQRTLRIRFCYRNSFRAVSRAVGVASIPVCVLCGLVALPFGSFVTAQGFLALLSAALLALFEVPLAQDACRSTRRHPMKRAFMYSLFVRPFCFLHYYSAITTANPDQPFFKSSPGKPLLPAYVFLELLVFAAKKAPQSSSIIAICAVLRLYKVQKSRRGRRTPPAAHKPAPPLGWTQSHNHIEKYVNA